MPTRDLAEMTWEEVRDAAGKRLVAILPVGAIEAHGPHLPLGTDLIIAEAWTQAAAVRLERDGFEVMRLPPVAYTAAPFGRGFSGTISVDPAGVTALVTDLAVELGRQGVVALGVANAHLDPANLQALRAAVARSRLLRDASVVACPDLTRKPWALCLGDEFRSGACHAGRFESSIVLAARPELVHDAIRRGLPPNPASLSAAIREGKRSFEEAGGARAYFGWPADATAEEGHSTLAALGGILADAVLEALATEAGGVTHTSLQGRRAVVTGGGRGIGAAVAEALAHAGASVLVAARTTGEVERVAGALVRRGATAWAVSCDVTDPEGVRRLAEAAAGRLGGVDILVNNVGAAVSAPLKRITLEEWNRMFAVNVTSAFLCTQAFLPGMVARGWGRVVNMASVAGLRGERYIAHYSAAKHALVGLTRAVAAEVAGTGVTVNAVCPGYVDTPMTDRTLANVATIKGFDRDGALHAVLQAAGQARLITPDEVASAVLALCTDAAGRQNGEAVVIEARG